MSDAASGPANGAVAPVVLLINPNTSRETTAMMHGIARAALPPAFALESATAARGARMITTAEELSTSIEEVLSIGQAQASRVSAIVISAFGDPGLGRLRERVDVPVVGIGEAALREAAEGGRRFGVATTTPELEAPIVALVERLGLAARFTGCRIPPGDPLVLAANSVLQDEALAEAVRDAVERDGAQAVVIGGGPLSRSAERIAGRFAVPVIAPVAAAMRAVAATVSSMPALPSDRPRLPPHPESASDAE
ncbi:MAG: aspartate/glutamate racemase family protein [Variovorax sp.]|jgi:Asp/Glu/hydantoin racemase|nr:MAG: aspartate/glutamate racemase family protein [Variovorax sp.]